MFIYKTTIEFFIYFISIKGDAAFEALFKSVVRLEIILSVKNNCILFCFGNVFSLDFKFCDFIELSPEFGTSGRCE